MSDEQAPALDNPAATGALAMPGHGGRILVVEDEVLISMMIETSLLDAGYQPIVANTLAEAISAIAEQVLDAAILDLHVAGAVIDPVADQLDRAGIPFVFATGGDAVAIARFPGKRFLAKPFVEEDLIAAVAALLAEIEVRARTAPADPSISGNPG